MPQVILDFWDIILHCDRVIETRREIWQLSQTHTLSSPRFHECFHTEKIVLISFKKDCEK